MEFILNKEQVIKTLLSKAGFEQKETALAFAPANIALVKYWGKRDQELNLPVTSSLSLTISVGTETKVSLSGECDGVWLNGQRVASDLPFSQRLKAFCDLFRPTASTYFHIETKNDIPTKAGLASSASGFAAMTLAFNDLFGWNLDSKSLSLLARLGSGSACRSLFDGFVEWHRGTANDGLDSFAERLDAEWPELKMGLWIISSEEKSIDSRKAMQTTLQHSKLYSAWPEKVRADLISTKEAIYDHDFSKLAAVAESNALSMHATMMASLPPILYWLPETIKAMHQIWQWRKEGLELYFTMDAGPNIKLLFLQKDQEIIERLVPSLRVVR